MTFKEYLENIKNNYRKPQSNFCQDGAVVTLDESLTAYYRLEKLDRDTLVVKCALLKHVDEMFAVLYKLNETFGDKSPRDLVYLLNSIKQDILLNKADLLKDDQEMYDTYVYEDETDETIVRNFYG